MPTRTVVTKLEQQKSSGTPIPFRLIYRIIMASYLQDCVILPKGCIFVSGKVILTKFWKNDWQ